jgi:hypothetical protein
MIRIISSSWCALWINRETDKIELQNDLNSLSGSLQREIFLFEVGSAADSLAFSNSTKATLSP